MKTKNINVRVEPEVAEAFNSRIKENNSKAFARKVTQGSLLRDFMIRFIKKK